MQEPRFKVGDKVRVIRILPMNMDRSGNLPQDTYEKYLNSLLNKIGTIAKVNCHPSSGYMTYDIKGIDLGCFFHEEELNFL